MLPNPNLPRFPGEHCRSRSVVSNFEDKDSGETNRRITLMTVGLRGAARTERLLSNAKEILLDVNGKLSSVRR